MGLTQSTPALKFSSYSCALLIHNNGFHHLHLWRDLASLCSWHMAGLVHACMLDDACVDRYPKGTYKNTETSREHPKRQAIQCTYSRSVKQLVDFMHAQNPGCTTASRNAHSMQTS